MKSLADLERLLKKSISIVMDKTLLKTNSFPVCNRNFNNHVVKCELCETSLHKTCGYILFTNVLLVVNSSHFRI